MTLADLAGDERLRRREFPVCGEKIFLAHAGVCPLPARVTAAMTEYLAAAGRDDQEEVLPAGTVGQTRQAVARLLEVSPEEVAFTGSTSMGLGLVAAGLDWQAGDNVVCYRDDYPANVYPWLNLAGRGVEVRFVEPATYGRVTVEDVARVLDERTRLVALASVHFVSGWRLAVDEIGEFLKQKGILFCLDGIQSFGALRTSLRYVDFAAADAHKWLLGPLGIALLFVRRENFERLRPVLVGWHNAVCPNYLAQDRVVFWPDARRYEPGSLNLTGIVGLGAAVELILEVGLPAVEERVLSLARMLVEQGQALGRELIGPPRDGASGIVSFRLREDDEEDVQTKLASAGVVASVRSLRDGGKCVRFSPHFYNTVAEIEATMSFIQHER
jgi:selenocysteine lyase/cysteine desulfurase